ncbi:MAG: hypothetical protein GX776_03170 [Oxalobacter sp.]|nr:hypothetical protein [Oxalobacter sp.]
MKPPCNPLPMQVHDELLESADDAVNDAYADSFPDVVFGYVAPHNTFFSAFWDIHILSLFDDYTRLARELCEILSVQTCQIRPNTPVFAPGLRKTVFSA